MVLLSSLEPCASALRRVVAKSDGHRSVKPHLRLLHIVPGTTACSPSLKRLQSRLKRRLLSRMAATRRVSKVPWTPAFGSMKTVVDGVSAAIVPIAAGTAKHRVRSWLASGLWVSPTMKHARVSRLLRRVCTAHVRPVPVHACWTHNPDTRVRVLNANLPSGAKRGLVLRYMSPGRCGSKGAPRSSSRCELGVTLALLPNRYRNPSPPQSTEADSDLPDYDGADQPAEPPTNRSITNAPALSTQRRTRPAPDRCRAIVYAGE